MKLVNVNKLKINDWIVTTNDITKGKLEFGKIVGYRIEKIIGMDLDKQKVEERIRGHITGEGAMYVLNKKELEGLMKVKIKLGIIKGLE